MTVTAEQVAARCGATLPRDQDAVNSALATAQVLVADYIAGITNKVVPGAVSDECVLRCAFSLYKKAKGTEGGSLTSADGTGVPGVANDPLRTSYPLLKRYRALV